MIEILSESGFKKSRALSFERSCLIYQKTQALFFLRFSKQTVSVHDDCVRVSLILRKAVPKHFYHQTSIYVLIEGSRRETAERLLSSNVNFFLNRGSQWSGFKQSRVLLNRVCCTLWFDLSSRIRIFESNFPMYSLIVEVLKANDICFVLSRSLFLREKNPSFVSVGILLLNVRVRSTSQLNLFLSRSSQYTLLSFEFTVKRFLVPDRILFLERTRSI